MENSHPHTPSAAADDIDLLVLAQRCLTFFRRFRWLFIAATVAGLAAGYIFYKLMPRQYRSEMILHSFLLTNPEQISIVSGWNEMLTKGEYAALATTLNCPETLLRQVKKLKAKELQQVFTSQNPNGFSLGVSVTDNVALPALQTALVYGFEHSPYVKDRLTLKRNNLEQLIATTAAEINKLDATKKQMEAIIRGEQKAGASLLLNGSDINRQLVEMNEKLLGFKENLQFTSAVQVLQPFTAFHKPADPKLIPWLVIGLVFFLALAYVYALIRVLWERMETAKKKSTLNNNS